MIIQRIKDAFRILFNLPKVGDVVIIQRYYLNRKIDFYYLILSEHEHSKNEKCYTIVNLDKQDLKLPEIYHCFKSQVFRIIPKYSTKKNKDKYTIIDYCDIP